MAWHAGALPVELNLSRSLRTIVAGTMMKCAVRRLKVQTLVTVASTRHAKKWGLGRKHSRFIISQQDAWELAQGIDVATFFSTFALNK